MTVYLAWFSNNQRVGYKHRLCAPCSTEYVGFFVDMKPEKADSETVEWPELCSGCGTKTAEDFDPTYLTFYPPKEEARQFVLCQCSNCAMVARQTISKDAELQVERATANGRPGAGPLAQPQEVSAFAEIQWTIGVPSST